MAQVLRWLGRGAELLAAGGRRPSRGVMLVGLSGMARLRTSLHEHSGFAPAPSTAAYHGPMPSSTRTLLHPAWGVAVGFCAGVTVLVAYFVQASVTNGLFWDVFVLPALGALILGAITAAMLSSSHRGWWCGVAGGVLLIFPLCIAGFILLAMTIGLD